MIMCKRDWYCCNRENRFPPDPDFPLSDKRKVLSLHERKYIEKYCKEYSASSIAKKLHRGKNAVIVELRRNGGVDVYDGEKAHILATNRLKIKTRQYDVDFEDQVKVIALWKKGETTYKISDDLNITYGEVQRILIDHFCLKAESDRKQFKQTIENLEKRIIALEMLAFGKAKVSKGLKE